MSPKFFACPALPAVEVAPPSSGLAARLCVSASAFPRVCRPHPVTANPTAATNATLKSECFVFMPLIVALRRPECPTREIRLPGTEVSRNVLSDRCCRDSPRFIAFPMQKSPTSVSPGIVAQALNALVSQIPTSSEKRSATPEARVATLAKNAALKAAAISGGFTLPPGPLGLATVLPDLLTVWRIQQQLVADIAAALGRTDALTRETMLLCLFKHGGAALTQTLLSRGKNNDIVVNRIANRALQQLLEKIAIRVGQRLAAKSVSRWIPLLGALGAGAYAYYDTTHVAANARDLFSKPLQLAPASEPETGTGSDADSKSKSGSSAPRRQTRARSKAKSAGSQSSTHTAKRSRRRRKATPKT